MAAGLVVVGVLVAGGVVADGVARSSAEARLATTISAELPGTEPTVRIAGTPFLTQVLAGRLAHVEVSAPAAELGGLALRGVLVQLDGVSTDQPTTAQQMTLTATVQPADLQEVLGLDVELSIDDGLLVASVDVLGVPIDIALEPRADGRSIAVDVASLSFGGLRVDVEDLPSALAGQLTDLVVPVEDLPEGISLTDVVVAPDGVHLTASGTDVVLDALRVAP